MTVRSLAARVALEATEEGAAATFPGSRGPAMTLAPAAVGANREGMVAALALSGKRRVAAGDRPWP